MKLFCLLFHFLALVTVSLACDKLLVDDVPYSTRFNASINTIGVFIRPTNFSNHERCEDWIRSKIIYCLMDYRQSLISGVYGEVPYKSQVHDQYRRIAKTLKKDFMKLNHSRETCWGRWRVQECMFFWSVAKERESRFLRHCPKEFDFIFDTRNDGVKCDYCVQCQSFLVNSACPIIKKKAVRIEKKKVEICLIARILAYLNRYRALVIFILIVVGSKVTSFFLKSNFIVAEICLFVLNRIFRYDTNYP